MTSYSEVFARLLLMALLLQVSAFAASGQETGEVLRFVGNDKIPPIISLEDQQPTGLAVDLAYAVAAKAHLPIRVDAMNWPDAQAMVLAGKAAALLQINSNPQRERRYDFSAPLLESSFHIFRKHTHRDINDLSTLHGRTVGVEAGGFPAQFLKNDAQVHLVVIPNWKAGFEMLQRDQLDAVDRKSVV